MTTDPEYAERAFQRREYMRVYIFPAKYDCSNKTSIRSSFLKDGCGVCINNDNNILILGHT